MVYNPLDELKHMSHDKIIILCIKRAKYIRNAKP